jgi:DNA/RNA endonuclease G (NUC1)
MIAAGRVNVPTNFWKVIVLLRAGSNDLRRITRQTRVIAVDMPNDEGLSNKSWRDYLTTVDAIESATGYEFLSKVSETIQSIIERAKIRVGSRLLEGIGDVLQELFRGGEVDLRLLTNLLSNLPSIYVLP